MADESTTTQKRPYDAIVSALTGGSSKGIADILDSRRSRYYQSNPWINAYSLMQPIPVESGSRNLETGAINAAQSILGALMAAKGIRQAESNYANYAGGLYSGLMEGDEGLKKLAANPVYADIAAVLAGEQRKHQMERAGKFEDTLNEAAIKYIFSPEGRLAMRGGNQPTTELNRPMGVKPITEQYNNTFNELVANGVPAEQAATAATRQLEGARKADAESFTAAAKAREAAGKLRENASLTRQAVEGSGVTGPWNEARTLGARILALGGVTDQAQKLQAQSLFAPVAMEMARAVRMPGPVSEWEQKLYMSVAPGPQFTPQENEAIIARMEKMAGIYEDYANFVDAYRAIYNTSQGADRLWAHYKARNPFFVQVGPQQLETRPDRMPWQEFFGFDPNVGFTKNTDVYSKPEGSNVTLPPAGTSVADGAQQRQAPQIPAGMKLQQNPRTGETRIVPQ